MKALMIACLFSIAVVQPCLAGWRQKKHDATMVEVLTDRKMAGSLIHVPTHLDVSRIGSPWAATGWTAVSQSYAWYSITRGPGFASGNAIAHDELVGVEMSLSKKTTGYHYDEWEHCPPGVGEVELTKMVDITSRIDLQSGDAAAAAVGATSSTHILDGQPHTLTARVTDTVGATSRDVAGGISVPLPGAAGAELDIPISFPTRTGETCDDGGDRLTRTDQACPVTKFERDDRTTVRLFVYANVGPGGVLLGREAHCNAFVGGRAEMHFHLLTHARCPNPPVSGN